MYPQKGKLQVYLPRVLKIRYSRRCLDRAALANCLVRKILIMMDRSKTSQMILTIKTKQSNYQSTKGSQIGSWDLHPNPPLPTDRPHSTLVTNWESQTSVTRIVMLSRRNSMTLSWSKKKNSKRKVSLLTIIKDRANIHQFKPIPRLTSQTISTCNTSVQSTWALQTKS